MSTICPSITASDAAQFSQQVQVVESFVTRLHLDCMDGQFAPSTSLPPAQLWWPLGAIADVHLMFKEPLSQLETIISLGPHLVIIHAEADNAAKFIEEMEGLGIKVGLALLQDTDPESCRNLLVKVDHALIFSGKLGFFGGEADLGLLKKVAAIKQINPDIEIGWDGGVSDQNAEELINGGVDVLNVGGYIQNAPDAEAAFEKLNVN